MPQCDHLRRHLAPFAVTAAALTALLFPAISLGHGTGAIDTVQEHIAEDSVTYTPAEARRMERQTDAATAADARAAAAAVSSDPAASGRWGPVVPWPAVAIHVALLINGKVLAYDSSIPDGSDLNSPTGVSDTFTRATVWDPETGSQTKANAETGVNVFCTGLAHLMDGRIFLAGGNKSTGFIGIKATNVFDSSDNTWTRTDDMAYERWYPSVTPLANGEMLITEGHDPEDTDASHHIPEVRGVDGGIRELTGAPLHEDLYPWMDVGPNGLVYLTGPDKYIRSLDTSGSGTWTTLGKRDDEYRSYGSHAFFDIGKILVAGGGGYTSTGEPSSKTAEVVDLNAATPQVSATDSMEFPRRQYNLTVLADGTALATGGNSSGKALIDLDAGVYNAELWDPASGLWSTLAAEDKTRQYHSTALLLPDGRVLSAGGGVCGTCREVGYLERNAQVFSPPYLFKHDGSGDLAPRPVINSAPKTVPYNAAVSIDSPNAASVGKVALVRLGAVTHSVNMEQRYVPLAFSANGATITATSPQNANVAPPGYYMLFLVGSDGVPSVSKMVRIDPTASPRPAAPSALATAPVSPRNNNSPKVKGTAEAGSTVRIYSTGDCTGSPVASGSAAAFASPGLPVTVADDTSTSFRATATNGSDNPSPCSDPVTYVEDSSPPAKPSVTATAPSSPANKNNPKVRGTADAGSTVKLYSGGDCLGARVNGGPAATFASPGLGVTVADNTTTTLRATATDAAGNASPCSDPVSYVEDSSPPAAPSITATAPSSPANDNNPEVVGIAETGAKVKIYPTSDCSGNPLASGTAAKFASPGITVHVPADATTQLRATATDAAGNASTCSDPVTYVEDSSPPAKPSITATAPSSPSNRNNPKVKGIAETGSTVTLYAGANCLGARVNSGPAATFSSPGLGVTVADNTTTNLRATATDAAGNVSPCSASYTYVEDSSAPAAPSITATVPGSPANDNNPEVKGIAEAGSKVKIYPTSDCSGNPLASGTAAKFASPGITVHVPADATTQLRATATDAAGNASTCSDPVTYVEDSSPPAKPSITATAPSSPANDNSPKVKGFAEAGSIVKLYAGAKCSGAVIDSGPAATFDSPGLTATVADNTSTNLRATATDAAGNRSPCSAPYAYVEDSTGPESAVHAIVPSATDLSGNVNTTPAESPFRIASPMMMEPGKHRIAVAAIDVAGNVDRSQMRWSWRVKGSMARSRTGDVLLIVATASSGSRAG